MSLRFSFVLLCVEVAAHCLRLLFRVVVPGNASMFPVSTYRSFFFFCVFVPCFPPIIVVVFSTSDLVCNFEQQFNRKPGLFSANGGGFGASPDVVFVRVQIASSGTEGSIFITLSAGSRSRSNMDGQDVGI